MLPVRGVMAAAMLCPPTAGETSLASQVHAMSSSAGDHHQHHDGMAGQDTCKLCSACCSVPPLPSAAPAVPLPHAFAAAAFPALAAPAPSFLSDGQERPPRSI